MFTYVQKGWLCSTTQAMPMTEFLETGPMDSPVRLVLAHGAGGAMTSPFLETIADLLATRGIAVTRFEFAYMAARRTGCKRRPPPRAEALVPEYRAAVEQIGAKIKDGQILVIGGKSMGGRVASLLADELLAEGRIAGLVCLGYPFHPPRKPEQLRTEHLTRLRTPALIVQGERDPFGNRSEVERLSLSPSIRFHWAADGDHDLGPRGGKGFTRRGNLEAAADAVADFVKSLGGRAQAVAGTGSGSGRRRGKSQTAAKIAPAATAKTWKSRSKPQP